MTEPRTREALAVERDDLAALIIRCMGADPHQAMLIDMLMMDYQRLTAEIDARGEAVRAGVG